MKIFAILVIAAVTLYGLAVYLSFRWLGNREEEPVPCFV